MTPRVTTLEVALGDGSLTLRGLPPGDYYVAAVTQSGFAAIAAASEGEFLESLVARAAKVSLTEGGRRSVSLIGR